MICPQCGSNVSDNDRHCPSCGKLLDKGNIPNKSKTPPILVIGIIALSVVLIGIVAFLLLLLFSKTNRHQILTKLFQQPSPKAILKFQQKNKKLIFLMLSA